MRKILKKTRRLEEGALAVSFTFELEVDELDNETIDKFNSIADSSTPKEFKDIPWQIKK
ncbi:MAG: hypothetical protein V3V00_15660 [Saprospiraceae bacterium]